MNSFTHLVEDMDEAFVGDFDGSLCFMSLSIDFTSSNAGPHLGLSRDVSSANNNQNPNGMFDSVTQSRNKSINYGLNINHDVHNDNSNNCFNYFKRFKSAITSEANSFEEENMSESQNKIVRQLQQIKNCFNTTAITNTTTTTITSNTNNINNPATANTTGTNTTNNISSALTSIGSQFPVGGPKESEQHHGPRSSPHSSEGSCNRRSAASSPDESSRCSTTNARSPSPNSSKQKFQYVLAEPISVATKLTEDTMTYLNQGQAYEIKLENITDVAEVKKGFMCSIINIGFQERHMQQAENELWQQWSQQHPNEKIFSVDMKLSYNVFGVEWDGLNKYEFLWDSSKAAGVFIRVNSISTEFTPKKHGGEKGVPFKLSIETFSYNSKTHDSYFISAACCQVKVFKPKGAERKIRSDRDKIMKRPASEQEKYHKSCDHTIFRECPLSSLHPMDGDSLCYYRHSHGHFAQKQVVTNTNIGGTPSAQNQPSSAHNQTQEEVVHNNSSTNNNSNNNNNTNNNTNNTATSQNNQSVESASTLESDNEANNTLQRDYLTGRVLPTPNKNHHSSNYSANRLIQHNSHSYGKSSTNYEAPDNINNDHSYNNLQSTSETVSHTELLPFQQPTSFNQMYHTNQVRGVASLASINNSQHFGMAYYSLPNPIPSHLPPPPTYGVPTTTSLSSISNNSGHSSHNFHITPQSHVGLKGTSSIYRNFNHEKSTTPHSTSFKASNLAITSHNNFSSYHLGNHSDQHNCDNQIKETNDAGNGNYSSENYDSHPNHSVQSSNTHNHHQQQPFRQRSASLSTSNGHCSSYVAHMNQYRHGDTSYNSAMFDSNNLNATNNHWSSNNQANNSQITNSPNSVCTQGASSDEMNQNSDNNYNNYDCNNDNYDSDQNTSHKGHHQSTSESSSSSCCSRNKNYLFNDQNDNQSFDVARLIDNNITQLNVNSTCADVASWLNSNRFSCLVKTFNNFSGFDLLRLSKPELIEICGLLNGIRLYNNLHRN